MAFAKLQTMHTLSRFKGGKKKPEWLALLKEHRSVGRVEFYDNTFVDPEHTPDSNFHGERVIGKDRNITRCLFHVDAGYRVLSQLFDQYLEVRPKKAGPYALVDVKRLPDGELQILGMAFGSCIAMSEAFFSATVPQLKAARKLLA